MSSPDMSDPAVLGLVRRIYWRRFSRRMEWAGIDPDDALQDVMVSLIVRSRGRSAYDPERAALSTWVYVAISGIVINLADKARRARRRGALGGDSLADTVEAGEPIDAVAVADLAADMDIPAPVLRAMAQGEDAYSAAMAAGCGATEALSIVLALEA